ncbi:hypothetical protein GCM10022219_20830 [Microbacterium oryzae]|uniref:Uncharacterized protein n=1 Tax=Microbacterium oryzae TaxID=743009 RepID=A0A6I6DRW2_9MICO|nr:DUF6153 family protein [Microbacterium oryzae]QGU27675.1 hypothetical protein D7D94_08325 [Microbacterium oryzae]
MSVMTLRRAMHPGATWAHAFLLTSAAVLGVLIGLLGMHVLSTGTAHHAPAVIAESTHHSDSATTVGATGPDGTTAEPCSGDGCGGGMDAMAFMACVLALLAVGIVLAIRPARAAFVPHSLAPPLSAPVLVEAPSAPPDLHVLSISRR